jgi:hypothetical protein
MRLLVGCLLMLIALVYFQSERHNCSVSMSVDNWFLCITRGVDLGAPWRGLPSFPKPGVGGAPLEPSLSRHF